MLKSLREYIALLSAYLRPQKLPVFGLLVILAGNIGLQLYTPRVLRDFIDMALNGEDYAALVHTALVFVALVFLTQVISVAATYLSEWVAWTATNLLRVDLAAHCLRLDLSFHQANPPGALIERIDGDVDALSNFFSQFVVRILANGVLVAGVLVMLYQEDWRAGAGLTVFAVLAILAMLQIRKVGTPRWIALRQKNAEAFGFLGEMLQGTEDIRSNGAAGYVLYRFDQILHGWLPMRRKAMLAFSLIWTTTLLLFALGTGFSFGIGYWLWSMGAISAGTVYLIFNYTEMIRQPIEQLRRQMEDLQRAGASITRVQGLFAQQPKIRDGELPIDSKGALQVEFRDVSFRYGSDEIALNHIHFQLAPGKILGLLGRTGSGKSTLARLLLRLYEPESGEVCLNGMPIGSAHSAEISRAVGLVPQEIQIFQGTVRDNLTIFNQTVPDEQILHAIDEFELRAWFDRLPSGLDSELSRGGGLSAGEAQLLNFARVALRDPGLVILDEATSRLDPATENLLNQATERLLKGRTGIIIAHRLQTVRRADLIMILEEGLVIEYGERRKLMQDPASRFHRLLRTGLEEVLA